jgi:hypothetical protein
MIRGAEIDMDAFKEWLELHFVQALLLTLAGVVLGWLLGRWRRYRQWRRVAHGDAREVIAIEQMLVSEQPDGRVTMRIRSLGAAPLERVLPNPAAHDAFLHRARATLSTNPLISMRDNVGSYLLYLLTPWVCGLCRSGPFPHDEWVMAPVCEPGILSAHQATTILLVRRADLMRFLDWEWCKTLHVEHGSDGARILTIWLMAREFQRQLTEIKQLRQAGKRTTYVETMYLLDLGLDLQELDLPTRPVPWERFAKVLKELKLS